MPLTQTAYRALLLLPEWKDAHLILIYNNVAWQGAARIKGFKNNLQPLQGPVTETN